MASDNSIELSDNMSNNNNTPTIEELYEGCSHLGDHITYNAESNKLYIKCNSDTSGFSILLTEDGQYKTMLYYRRVPITRTPQRGVRNGLSQ